MEAFLTSFKVNQEDESRTFDPHSHVRLHLNHCHLSAETALMFTVTVNAYF